MNFSREKEADRTIVSLAVPLAIGVFVIGAAGTLFRPSYVVSGPAVAPVAEKHASADALRSADRPAEEPPVTLPMGRSVDAPKPALNSTDIQQAFDRGQGLVASGDFAGARLLFTRAAEAGHAGALFALASTFDPNILAARGARGLVGEPDQARVLYEKALDAGVAGARERLAALGD